MAAAQASADQRGNQHAAGGQPEQQRKHRGGEAEAADQHGWRARDEGEHAGEGEGVEQGEADEDAIGQHHAVALDQLRGIERTAFLDRLGSIEADGADDQQDQVRRRPGPRR